MIERTERGWAGHFVASHHCLFRRNTLLTLGETSVVVSTVGACRNPATDEIEEIGFDRFYETMAFFACKEGPYIEADVCREVPFESKWYINAMSAKELPRDVDNQANDMHEAVVAEIMKAMKRGVL